MRSRSDEQLDLLRVMVSQLRISRHSIDIISRVKRGIAASQPRKYVLDENELERVSALARIELEDARKELERAHEAAQKMGKGAEGEEADDPGDSADDGHEDEWIE